MTDRRVLSQQKYIFSKPTPDHLSIKQLLNQIIPLDVPIKEEKEARKARRPFVCVCPPLLALTTSSIN